MGKESINPFRGGMRNILSRALLGDVTLEAMGQTIPEDYLSDDGPKSEAYRKMVRANILGFARLAFLPLAGGLCAAVAKIVW